MGPVSAEIEIDVSRERAFELLGDLSRRPSFTDHFLRDYRLTRIEASGVGAGARFLVKQPLRSVWMDTAIVELAAPHRIVERGKGGRANRIPTTTVWEVLGGGGSLSRIKVAHWTEPPNPVDRALEALSFSAFFQEKGWREALRRLREQLESDAARPRALSTAGGNAHATGIP